MIFKPTQKNDDVAFGDVILQSLPSENKALRAALAHPKNCARSAALCASKMIFGGIAF
jgi:hypothetical protein